jgi:O-antigen ligase
MMGPSAQRAQVTGWQGQVGLTLDRQQALAQLAALLLTTLLFTVLVVGPEPFATQAADKAAIAESGNAFNRAVVVLSFGLALLIGTVLAGRVLLLAARCWLLLLILAWWTASYFWASHPDLVLRRAFAFGLVYLTLLVIAAAARSSRDLLWPLVIMFAVVTTLNVMAWQVIPAASWSEIGETGIFDNKNSAGTVAMLALIVLGGGLFAARRVTVRLTLLLCVLMAAAFLVATRSKTSIGLAGVIIIAGPVLYLLIPAATPIRFVALLASVVGGLALIVGLAAAGIGESDVRLMLFGDLTFTGRTEIWSHIVKEIARRPWLGHGFGSFWDTGALVNPILSAPPDAWFMNAQLINTAHNGYLDVWLQNGLIGLALAVLALLRCLFVITAEAAKVPTREERVALIVGLCVAICIALNNALESYLFRTGDTLGYLFVFIWLQAEAARLSRRKGLEGRG